MTTLKKTVILGNEKSYPEGTQIITTIDQKTYRGEIVGFVCSQPFVGQQYIIKLEDFNSAVYPYSTVVLYETDFTVIFEKENLIETEKDYPEVGDKIYIQGAMYIDHGEDDFCGGIATISKVEINPDLPNDHFNKIMIRVKEVPGHSFNYKALLKKQSELKERHWNEIAHPDPDYD